MKKKTLQAALALGTIAVGAFMLYSNAWPTMPAVSGLGFLMVGLNLWSHHCPIMRKFFK